MQYRDFELPDGSYVQVPETMSFEQADVLARQKFPDAYRGQQQTKPEETGFFANVKGGAKDLIAANKLGIGVFGNEDAARAEYRAAQQGRDNIRATSWEDVKAAQGIPDTISAGAAFARDTLAQSLPQMGQTMAGAGVGAKLGAAAAGPVGALVGAGVGGFAANMPAMFGANLGRQDEAAPNKPLDVGSAAAAAAGQSALDATSTLFLFGRLAGINKLAGEALPKLFKKPAEEVEKRLVASAQKSLAVAAGKGAVQGAVVEMPTELAQTVLERWQASLPLTGEEANREYEATLAGAAAVGGALGPIRGVTERGDARKEMAKRARTEEDAQRSLLASQEEEKKKKDEAFKGTPEYLTQLDTQFQERNKKLSELSEKIKAYGKPDATSAEALEKKLLEEQKRKLVKDTEELKAEFVARKEEIRKSKIDPQDFMMESLLTEPTVKAGSPTSLKEIREKIKAQQATPPAPDPTQQYVEQQAELARQRAFAPEGQPLQQDDINTYAEHILADPVRAAAAVKNNAVIPGIPRKQSNAILGLVKLQLQEQEKQKKAELAATMQQRQADLATQATNATEETDPLALLKQSLAEQDEFQNTGEQNFDYLNGVFEKALGEGNQTGPRKVALPEGVRPVSNAKNILAHVDSLYSEKDAADKALDIASRAGNKEAAMEAAANREKANTNAEIIESKLRQ